LPKTANPKPEPSIDASRVRVRRSAQRSAQRVLRAAALLMFSRAALMLSSVAAVQSARTIQEVARAPRVCQRATAALLQTRVAHVVKIRADPARAPMLPPTHRAATRCYLPAARAADPILICCRRERHADTPRQARRR